MSLGISKPRIAILTIRNEYGYGGVLTCVKQVYKFCQKYFDPTIFFLNFDRDISANLKSFKFSSQLKKEKYFGMNAVQIGARWAFWEPGHYVYTLPAWKELLKDYKYFFMGSGSCTAAYPLVQLNKKFVMWIATLYEDDKSERVKSLPWFRFLVDRLASFKMREIEKEILQKADFIWALSRNTKIRLEQILGHKRDNMIICNFPIVPKRVDVSKEIKKEKTIIAVGRFSDPRKNIEMLLRVFERIYQKMPELKLYVVGNKPSEKQLKEFCFKGFFKNVVFAGQVEQQKLDQLYRSAYLMIITSYQEGLGIVGLEAFSYGIPVVATDCGGTRDYVIEDQNGYLVKIDDDKDMVQKSLKILSNEKLYKKMQNYAARFVTQNFSENKIHSIFKVGLIRVYPELKSLFERIDSSLNVKTEKLYGEELTR